MASSPSSCSAPSTPILPMTAAGTLQGPQRAATAVLSSPRSALPSAAVLSSNPIRQATSPGPAARQAPVPPVPLLDFHRPLADLAASNPSEFSPRDSVWKRYFCQKDNVDSHLLNTSPYLKSCGSNCGTPRTQSRVNSPQSSHSRYIPAAQQLENPQADGTPDVSMWPAISSSVDSALLSAPFGGNRAGPCKPPEESNRILHEDSGDQGGSSSSLVFDGRGHESSMEALHQDPPRVDCGGDGVDFGSSLPSALIVMDTLNALEELPSCTRKVPQTLLSSHYSAADEQPSCQSSSPSPCFVRSWLPEGGDLPPNGLRAVAACAEIISSADLMELRSLSAPHSAVREVVETTLMLLGCRAKWVAAQAYFEQPEIFLEKLHTFDASRSISRLQYQKLCRSLCASNGAFEDGLAESICPACVGLVRWCRAVKELLAWRYDASSELFASNSSASCSGRIRSPERSPPAGEAHEFASGSNLRGAPIASSLNGAISKFNVEAFTRPAAQHDVPRDGTERLVSGQRPSLGDLEVLPDIYAMAPSELKSVCNLTIRRPGVGEVTFHGKIDLLKEYAVLQDLPAVVRLEPCEVVLYPDPDTRPQEGEGLNRPATITLFQCKPPSHSTFPDAESKARYRERIARMTREKGARFVDYDCDRGIWQFRVDHF